MNNFDTLKAPQAKHLPSKVKAWTKFAAIVCMALILLGAAGSIAFRIAKESYRNHLGQPPTQIHLAWDRPSDTSVTFMWHTRRAETPSHVRYRLKGDDEWMSSIGDQIANDSRGVQHKTALSNLVPNSTYEYQIKGDFIQALWSPTFEFRTAPSLGESDFDAIYFADTGLVGRSDGLDAGTEQIVTEIAQRKPLLALGGGDYAYYSSDDRHGSLDASIDAWLNQTAPVLTESIMMPTYGNHETVLRENYSLWAKRFATPPGTADGRNYSFNVGNVHFVSIFAIYEQQGLEQEALDWIEQDILDAQAAGMQWIVPYMHVAPFAEGASHPSNLALRAQLGPLFEKLDIKVVLTSHDQAFERTYPLQGVPEAIASTSESKSCYSMADGVTWVKTSPGGKLSNKSGGFSVFNAPPSPWVAIRDNTMHVFSKLHFTTDELSVETWGLKENGQAATLLDEFSYKVQGCNAAQ